MQREKNTHYVLSTLESSGWTFQNLIIWRKKTSAVPSKIRYGKHYQIIAFASKGSSPRVFNKLRIDPPLLVTEKHERPNGVYVTDVWDDIREMTSGYLAGDEPLRDKSGERVHKQQSPVHLLMRIILSSTNIGDKVFDPFAGTGTTLVAAKQVLRNSFGIEIDPINVKHIEKRISKVMDSDNLDVHRNYYRFTKDLESIWPTQEDVEEVYQDVDQLKLF
jgi:DNA modification methylase